MKKTVFSFGDQIQSIINHTMSDYPYQSVHNEVISSHEYSDSIPISRMLDDVAAMKVIFSDFVRAADNSLNDKASAFAMLCTCCTKYNLCDILSNQFDVDSFLTDITDKEEQKFLSLLGTAICNMLYPYKDTSSVCFQEAYNLFPDNEIINLYRFIGLVQLLYASWDFSVSTFFAPNYANTSDWQKIVHRDMINSYSKLSPTLQKYVLVGKDESSTQNSNLPYIEYASYSEKVVEGCLSDFHGIIKSSSKDSEIQRPSSDYYERLFERLSERLDHYQKIQYAVQNGAKLSYNREGKQSPLSRKHHLGIPCLVYPSAGNFHNLFKETLRAEERTAERDRAIAEKSTVIQDFAHAYGNMKATGLYAVAQALLKNENIEIKRLGRQVLLEYGIKQDLTKAVYLMRLRFEENTEQLRKLLWNSIAKDSETDIENINNILSSALQLSLLRTFYDGSDSKTKLARNQLKKAVEKLNPLRDSFEQEVIFDGMDAVTWMSQSITPIELFISDGWKQLRFYKESYATVFLRDIFAECFFNILKYANLSQPLSFRLSESDNHFLIELVNTVAEMDDVYSGVGLSSKCAMIDIVNGITPGSDTERSMAWGIGNGKFHTRIQLSEFILKGE